MKVVVDANVVISAFKRDSITRKVLLFPFISFYSPAYLLDELEEHKAEIMKKAKINEEEFNIILNLLLGNVKIVPKEAYIDKMGEALKIVGEIDKDDAPYFALALKIGAGIWSYDRKLSNQRKVKIFTTGELLEIIRKGTF